MNGGGDTKTFLLLPDDITIKPSTTGRKSEVSISIAIIINRDITDDDDDDDDDNDDNDDCIMNRALFLVGCSTPQPRPRPSR